MSTIIDLLNRNYAKKLRDVLHRTLRWCRAAWFRHTRIDEAPTVELPDDISLEAERYAVQDTDGVAMQSAVVSSVLDEVEREIASADLVDLLGEIAPALVSPVGPTVEDDGTLTGATAGSASHPSLALVDAGHPEDADLMHEPVDDEGLASGRAALTLVGPSHAEESEEAIRRERAAGGNATPRTDRVVAHLVATGVLGRDGLSRLQDEAARSGRTGPLWRMLLQSGDVPADTVYEAAASAYGFRPITISLPETIAQMAHLAWSQELWSRFVGLGTIPVVPSSGASSRMVFAGYDPASVEVPATVAGAIRGSYELRYLSQSELDSVLDTAREMLPGLLPAAVDRPVDEAGEHLRRAA